MTDEHITADSNESRLRAPWNLKDMIWGSLAAALFMGIGFGIVFGVMILLMILGLGENPAPFAVLALALEAVLLVPAWVWGPSKYGGGWRALGLRRFRVVQLVLMLAIGLVTVLVVNALWELVRQRMGSPGQGDVLSMLGGGVGGLLVALLLGGVLAPVAEEVFFRGFLYAGMRSRWGVGWALVASSLIFALIHLTPSVLPPLFIMGLLLAYLYERSNSLWPSVLLHAAVNSIAFIGMYIAARMT